MRGAFAIAMLAASLAGFAGQKPASSTSSEHHQQVARRGDTVMGFSHLETRHHFRLFADGGEIEVLANDPRDTAVRDQIRYNPFLDFTDESTYRASSCLAAGEGFCVGKAALLAACARAAGIPARVATVEYDPNRSALIALVNYADGEKRYILYPQGLKVGDKIVAGPDADIVVGNALPLKNIPTGTLIHNIEMRPGKGGQLVRSAGGAAQLLAKEGDYAQVRLPSGEVRKVHMDCMASIGQVGNLDHENITFGKAGRKRWMGIRPTVRGVAMNPIDHPHGGGEGRTSGGRHPVTPWGKPTKGKKTRTNKSTNKFILLSRHKRKK